MNPPAAAVTKVYHKQRKKSTGSQGNLMRTSSPVRSGAARISGYAAGRAVFFPYHPGYCQRRRSDSQRRSVAASSPGTGLCFKPTCLMWGGFKTGGGSFGEEEDKTRPWYGRPGPCPAPRDTGVFKSVEKQRKFAEWKVQQESDKATLD